MRAGKAEWADPLLIIIGPGKFSASIGLSLLKWAQQLFPIPLELILRAPNYFKLRMIRLLSIWEQSFLLLLPMMLHTVALLHRALVTCAPLRWPLLQGQNRLKMVLLIHGPSPLMDPVPSTPPAPGLSCAEVTLEVSSSSGEIVEHAPIDVSVGPVLSVNMPPRVPCSLPPCYPTDGSGHSYSSGVLISEVDAPQGNGETLSEVKTPSASNAMVLYSSGSSKERVHIEDACPISSRIGGRDMSFWMEDKLLNFGKFLGVSVEGKEDRVLELLREIEQQSRYDGVGRELGKGVKQNNLGDVVVYQRRGRV
nr:uncharacterized protein LOC104097554 [Nicotiana tomentosiformis]